ncbi:hypothetical protein CL653_01650 [bacterium]|nr:hypothetical protein [bacterium]
MFEFFILNMSVIPDWYTIATFALLGGIIGSFLNVVAYRMHTGASLSGRSRCFSCGKVLSPWELVPFFSWLLQKGQCRDCGARIPIRDFLVESLTGAMFVWVLLTSDTALGLGLNLILVSLIVLVFIYDLVHMIIPDELVLLLLFLGLGNLLYIWLQVGSWELITSHVYAALVTVGILGSLWLVSHGRWIGLGDVKLILPLGLFLNISEAMSMVMLSFWIGALVGVMLLIYPKAVYLYKRYTLGSVAKSARYFTMKSEIPFAPFILVAFWLVYLYDINVFDLFTYTI